MTREAMEANAQRGHCPIALTASTADIPAVVSEALQEGMYCFFKDFFNAIERAAEALIKVNPHDGKTFVMIKRQAAMETILALVVAETKIGGFLDNSSGPEVELYSSHKELKQVTHQVKLLLTKASTTEISIEEFNAEIDLMKNPQIARKLLGVMSMNAPRVRSLAGPIDLCLDNKPIRDLPSNRTHEIEVTITRGFDDQANTVHVIAKTLVDADPGIFTYGAIFRILCLDPEKRVLLLLAQALRKPVRVCVSVLRVPIFPRGPMDILATLEHITLLDCEDDDQLKDMLLHQLQLEI